VTPRPNNEPASPNLDVLLKPKSVAVVGASERPGSVGDQTYRQLIRGGFEGAVYVVNPGYETIHGAVSYGSVSDIPHPAELTVLAVANHLLESQLELAVESGTKAVTIFASCHGDARDGTPLRDRLRVIADKAGIPICGGNGMGFLNVEDNVRVCGFYQPALKAGGVAFISHSGSLFSAMLHNQRGIGFNLVVSSGLEINTTMDRYIDWALDRESTKVIALFLETVRNPEGFNASLERADKMGIPVVALKVGSSSRGRAAVATHSDALAGEETTYQALFDHYGVHGVKTPDELLDTIEIFASGRRAAASGLGAVHDSGGERALLIDTADRLGLWLPDLSPSTVSRLEAVLDPGLEPANPVDAWGTGQDAKDVFTETLLAVSDDDSIGVVAFCVDLTPEERPDDAYSHAAEQAAAATTKPVVVIANLASAVDPIQADSLRSSGIPVLEGIETGLSAVGHLLRDFERRADRISYRRLSTPSAVPEGILTEPVSLGLLSDYGIEVPASALASTVDSASLAARQIGYPVVVKTANSAHKSDIEGVALNVMDEAGLRAVVTDLQNRLGSAVVVAKQVARGVEVSLGMYRDPQFGPIVLIGAGGVLVEYLDDQIAILPPVTATAARRAIDRLRIRPIFDGVRGVPPSDIESLASTVARFSELVVDHVGAIASIDVNPLIVGPKAAVAVDVLIERL
jgi:acetate---CoA ligase (ADP-forming)